MSPDTQSLQRCACSAAGGRLAVACSDMTLGECCPELDHDADDGPVRNGRCGAGGKPCVSDVGHGGMEAPQDRHGLEASLARLKDEAQRVLGHDSINWVGALADAFRELMHVEISAVTPVGVRRKADRRCAHLS